MQQHIKYLVIEDEKPWSDWISTHVRAYFEGTPKLHASRIRSFSAYDGDQANQQLLAGQFDLVTVDLCLGAGVGRSKISGLDLLGEIAHGSCGYFVIIVTGAITDSNLERVYGRETAARMRYGALNEAVKLLPAERVRLLHKPANKSIEVATQELAPHLRSALDQYCSVSIERNIFRPFPGHDTLWEVRYNGGPRLTIPRIQPFEMIRSALSQPNREMKVIDLIQRIAQSSGKAGPVTVSECARAATCVNEEDTHGIGWEDVDTFGTVGPAPVDTDEGALDLESLIGALLLAKRQGLNLSEAVKEFAEAYGTGPVLSLPGRIKMYSSSRSKSELQFAMDRADLILAELYDELAPLLQPYKEQHRKEPNADNIKKPRIATGRDTKELMLARAHWKRARTALRKYPALRDFLAHIENCVDRGFTAKGHIYYAPTDGAAFAPFWLTE